MPYKRELRPLRGAEFPPVTHRLDSRNWPRAFARDSFFRFIDEEVPEVREVLIERVYPVFPAAFETAPTSLLEIDESDVDPDDKMSCEYQILGLRVWQIRKDPALLGWYWSAVEAGHPGCQTLNARLSNWAWDFNLSENWIGDAALRTMIGWHCGRELGEDWLPYRPEFPSALSEEEQHFTMDLPGAWDPVVISLEEAKRRIAGVFNLKLSKFLKRGIEIAVDRGYEETKSYPRELEKHLRWLVRYQVAGESHTEIAKSPDPEDANATAGRKTVSDGVHSAAKAIALTLRVPDAGAIKPSKSS